MKKICLSVILMMSLAMYGTVDVMAAPTKQQKRVVYTLKNLKLDATTQKSLQPLLLSYLQELKAAQKPYDDLKEKYKNDIDKGTLTDKVASALLTAKWTAAKNENTVKEKYDKLFRNVIPAKKVWYCFDLLNDKMSKIEGTKGKTSNTNDDEDE